MSNVARFLSSYADQQGISQRTLASTLGVSQAWMSRASVGELKSFDPGTITKAVSRISEDRRVQAELLAAILQDQAEVTGNSGLVEIHIAPGIARPGDATRLFETPGLYEAESEQIRGVVERLKRMPKLLPHMARIVELASNSHKFRRILQDMSEWFDEDSPETKN